MAFAALVAMGLGVFGDGARAEAPSPQRLASARSDDAVPGDADGTRPPANASLADDGALAPPVLAAMGPEAATPELEALQDARTLRHIVDHGVRIVDTPQLGLKMGLFSQIRFDADARADTVGFTVPIARIPLRAHVGDWMRLVVQPEFAGGPARLLDAAADFSLVGDALMVRVGQWSIPFTRAYSTSLTALVFPERPMADAHFRAGRDTGALAFGHVAGETIEWNIGAFNGSGINRANDDATFHALGRVVLTPLGAVAYSEIDHVLDPSPFRFALGLSVLYGDGTTPSSDGTTALKHRSLAVATDLVVQFDWFQFQLEYYQRTGLGEHARGETDRGGYAQFAWTALRDTLQLAARVNLIDDRSGATPGTSWAAELGVAWHVLGNHLKLQGRVGVVEQPAVGRVERMTLQLQVLL